MKNVLKTIGGVIAGLITLDIFILSFSLLQVSMGKQTGYWSPFWMEQARFIIGLLN
jgi:hypothetical protein